MDKTTSNKERQQWTEQLGESSRRRFLGAAGALGIIGSTGGMVLTQEDSTTYRFGGEVQGWQAEEPPEIQGEVNPTLTLEAGTEYTVIWENLDGVPHDFVIQDADGNDIVGTEVTREEGATRELTFTASEEMAQYICTIHPTSMVGEIEFGGGGTATEQQPTDQTRFVPEGPSVGAQLVADGPLVSPVNLRTVPGMENTHLVADQVGRVYVLDDGELRDEPFLDLTDQVMILADTDGNFDRPEGFDERGLLGMDFHPDFEENGLFYVRYSAAEPDCETLVGPGDRKFPDGWDHVAVLSEFQVAGSGDSMQTGTHGETETATSTETETTSGGDGEMLQADPESERILLEVPEPQFNHNGGEVTFGPDGYLYTSLGDGGGADDDYVGHVDDWYDENEGGNAQDLTENLLGSILRIDVDAMCDETPYVVPRDNPLVGTDAFDEQYAWGLRNPWRMSFNDDMLITGDVGQSLFEEIDLIEAGGNYGWNVREGFHCFNAADATQVPDQCPTHAPQEAPYDGQPLLDPQLEYPHTYQGNQVGISITGGYVYQSDEISSLSDQYLFGDWSQSFTQPQGRVFMADTSGQDTPSTPEGTETETTEAGTTDTGTSETGTPMNGSTETTDTANATTTETEGTAAGDEESVDVQEPSEQPWPYQEVVFDGGENGMLNRFVQAFGRDDQGNVYVLASRTGRLLDEAGEVYRLVPAGEGDEITPPPTPTGTPDGEGEDTETTTANGTETETETETEENETEENETEETETETGN